MTGLDTLRAAILTMPPKFTMLELRDKFPAIKSLSARLCDLVKTDEIRECSRIKLDKRKRMVVYEQVAVGNPRMSKTAIRETAQKEKYLPLTCEKAPILRAVRCTEAGERVTRIYLAPAAPPPSVSWNDLLRIPPNSVNI